MYSIVYAFAVLWNLIKEEYEYETKHTEIDARIRSDNNSGNRRNVGERFRLLDRDTEIVVNADSKTSYQQASLNEITHSVEYTAKTATSPTTLYTDSTAWEDCKLYVVLDGSVTISSHITVTGTVNLSLTDGNTLTATKDITIAGNNTLNI